MEYLTYWITEYSGKQVNFEKINKYFLDEIVKNLKILNLPIPQLSLNESNENLFTLLYDIKTFGYNSDKNVRDLWRFKYHFVFDLKNE